MINHYIRTVISNIYMCVCLCFPSCSPQAWWRMLPVLPTGCLTKISCPATTANASSLPSCPSTTVAPAGKVCVTTAPRSADQSPHGAGTTPCASALSATRSPETFNRGRRGPSFLRVPERTTHSLTQPPICYRNTSVTQTVLSWICGWGGFCSKI